MPGHIVQAHTGGTSPKTKVDDQGLKLLPVEGELDPRGHGQGHQQPQLHHQGDGPETGQDQEHHHGVTAGPVWVKGCTEEDRRRYEALMAYMEEKRVEARELLREEKERKDKAEVK